MRLAIERGQPRTIAVLPALLTLANAICGFVSIAVAAGAQRHVGSDEPIFLAGILIFAAMVFDMMDGYVARLVKHASRFGEQLDSMCDVVSFGVAPGFLVLNFSTHYPTRFLLLVSVLYVLCVVVRLARFNCEIDDSDPHHYFSGLPSPAAAGLIASFAVSMPGLRKLTEADIALTERLGEWLMAAAGIALPLFTIVIAFLMVSRIRYPHVNQWFRGRRQLHHLVQMVVALLAAVAVHEFAIPLILFCFVFASPVRAGWTKAVEHHERRKPRRRFRRRSESAASRSQPRRFRVLAWRNRARGDRLLRPRTKDSGDRDGSHKDSFTRK
jgi:CDP-diacylglycerol--serine O-phosphatidyltransferase